MHHTSCATLHVSLNCYSFNFIDTPRSSLTSAYPSNLATAKIHLHSTASLEKSCKYSLMKKENISVHAGSMSLSL